MTTMLEKMQAAICCYDGCRHSDTCGAHGYEVKARAVLDAMLEPTEAMLLATFPRGSAGPLALKASKVSWQAMIQAIKDEADD